MIAEAIEKLELLIREKNSIAAVNDERNRCTYLRLGNEHRMVPWPPKRISATLVGIEDVVAAALDPVICSAPEVYVAPEAVVVLANRADRHETLRMPLVRSQRWDTLSKLGGTLSPDALIRLLRFDLPCDAATLLIPKLRKVDFTRRSNGSKTTEHGRESFGQSVEAIVQGVEDIDQEITITVPVFGNPGLQAATTVSVRCGIYIDTQQNGFQIRPLADELTNGLQAACSTVCQILRKGFESKVPVLYGTP